MLTPEERCARFDAAPRPPVMLPSEAFRYVDEATPLDVLRVIKELLRIQEAWVAYASLADLDDEEDMSDVG